MLGAAQVQVPLEHTSLVPHGLPQLPQFAGSLVGSTQTPLQSMVGDGQTHAPFTRWSCAKADGTPPSNAPLSCSVIGPRSAMLNGLGPPLRSVLTTARNWRTVMPFSGNVPTWQRTRWPNGGARVPCTRASEKSTLNCSARTSPPNVPADVPIGSSTLPLSGPGGPIAGRYARTDAASVKAMDLPEVRP